jgi:SAM-dependent methyltransferase
MPTGAPPADRIRDVNIRYHDAAANEYDSKWGIDFGPIGRRQVHAKFAKAFGGRMPAPFGDALEIGAGTGYFTLNLLQGGAIGRATATDISPGMLARLDRTAARLDLEVRTVASGAEELPFPDESFDLVFGHAVLHHIPDVGRAFAEFRRVLRPGGALAFCGEPSAYGDTLAAAPKRLGMLAAPLWRRALGAAASPETNGGWPEGDHILEYEVDVHAFTPADLRRALVRAGFEGIALRGEELVASLYGWFVRTVESTADPAAVPTVWRRFAFRSYLALQRIDSAVLEPRLPPRLFYNLVLSARRPDGPSRT